MFKKLADKLTSPIRNWIDDRIAFHVEDKLYCSVWQQNVINEAVRNLSEYIKNTDRWQEMIADVTKNIDVQDIANGIDPSDVANYVEVDVSELADTIDHSMVASYVETDEVASEVMQKIVSKLEALV